MKTSQIHSLKHIYVSLKVMIFVFIIIRYNKAKINDIAIYRWPLFLTKYHAMQTYGGLEV